MLEINRISKQPSEVQQKNTYNDRTTREKDSQAWPIAIFGQAQVKEKTRWKHGVKKSLQTYNCFTTWAIMSIGHK